AIIMMAMTRVGRDLKGGRGRRGKRRRGNDPGNGSHVLVPSYFAGTTSLATHVSKRNPVTPERSGRETHGLLAARLTALAQCRSVSAAHIPPDGRRYCRRRHSGRPG